jgi:Ran GTPase-activating protein (RanGAP) involved in mRNA processing and transport
LHNAFNNRALSKFDISKNNLRAEGGKALAVGLKGNQLVTELNISSNNLGFNSDADSSGLHFDSGSSGVATIADAISNMRALTKFDISDNILRANGTKVLADALKGNQTMIALDISSNSMTSNGNTRGDMSGVAALADVITDMRALLLLDISINGIPPEQKKGFERACTADGIELAI